MTKEAGSESVVTFRSTVPNLPSATAVLDVAHYVTKRDARIINSTRFEVLTAVQLKLRVFWDMPLCG